MSLAMNVQLVAPRAAAPSSSRGSSVGTGDASSSFDAAFSTATQAHSAEQGGRKPAARDAADSASELTPDAAGAPHSEVPATAATGDPRAATWNAAGLFQLATAAEDSAGATTIATAPPTPNAEALAQGAVPAAIVSDVVSATASSLGDGTLSAPAAVLPSAPGSAGATVAATTLIGTANTTAQSVVSSSTSSTASLALPVGAATARSTALLGTGAARPTALATSSAPAVSTPVAGTEAAETNLVGAVLSIASDGASAEGNAGRHNATSVPTSSTVVNSNPAALASMQAGPASEAAQQRSDAQPLAASASTAPLTAAAALAPASMVSSASATAATAAPSVPIAQPNAPLNTQLARPILTVVAAGDGTHTLTVTVTPERLGPVTVQAVVAGDKLRLELFAPTEQAREAVRGILGELRRDLAGTGLHTSLGLSSDDAPSKQGNGQLSQQNQSGAGGQAARDALSGEQRESAQHSAERTAEQQGGERTRAAQPATVVDADADALALNGAATVASAHVPLDLIA